MIFPYHKPVFLTLLVAAFAFTGCCRDSSADAADTPAPDVFPEMQAYFEEHAEFYRFRTPDDIPEHLEWVDNMHLPDLGSPEARKGGIQYSAMQDFPRTFRIVGPEANNSFRRFLLDDVLVGLAHLHPNVEGEHQSYPGIAREWALDYENRTVYVRLNPDARWSDGVSVTADDIVFMFFFYQSKYINDPWYNNWYGVGNNYTNVTRYDSHTLSITMKEARPDLERRILTLRPLPAHFFRELGDDFAQRYQWRFMPTTGAYVITDEEVERMRFNRDRIRLTRLKDWWAQDLKFWRNRFNPDEIRLRVIRDTPKAFEAFLLGQLDMFGMNLTEYNYDMLPDDHPLVERGFIHKSTFYNDVPRPTWGLWINTSMPLLSDKDIRKGIHYATNWQLVLDQFFRGDYDRMNTVADGYDDMTHPDIRARPFDPGRAMEYFAKAGFTRRGPDGILVNDRGQRLSFTITTGQQVFRGILSILREEARKAGLELQSEILDASANWLKVQEKNHEIAFSGLNVSVERYPRFWETYHSSNAYLDAFLPDGTPNPERKLRTQTNNMEAVALWELDQLIERYDESDSIDEMRDLTHRMAEILHEHASFVPGFVAPQLRLAHWRWVRWPDDFNARFARDTGEFYLHWIDEDIRSETQMAMKTGGRLARFLPWVADERNKVPAQFPKRVRTFDQWRVNPDEN